MILQHESDEWKERFELQSQETAVFVTQTKRINHDVNDVNKKMYQLQLSSKIALLGGGRAVTHVTPTRKMDVFHFRRRRVGQLLSLLGDARPCCFF